MNERPTAVGFWTMVVFATALIVYPLSFGPACWITSWTGSGAEMISKVYQPALWMRSNGPEALGGAIDWYAHFGVRKGWGWWIRFSRVGAGEQVQLHWGGPT